MIQCGIKQDKAEQSNCKPVAACSNALEMMFQRSAEVISNIKHKYVHEKTKVAIHTQLYDSPSL